MTKPKQRLAITLFKSNVHSFNECLSGKPVESEHEIKQQFNIEGKIYIGVPTEDSVDWLAFLQEGTDDAIKGLINISHRAAIIVKRGSRFLGLSFGYGQALFDKKKVERNFGLKVVINSVDPKSLRSFDSAKLDDNIVLTRKQSSRGGNQTVFGSDIPTELLCGVSGKSTEPLLGKSVAGKDQLLIAPNVDFTNIGDIIDLSLSQYAKTIYQNHFPWYDNIQIEQDSVTCDALNVKLSTDLATGVFDQFSFAAPEVYDPLVTQGFSFKPKGEILFDLEFDEFISYLQTLPSNDFSVDYLKGRKVYVRDDNGEEADKWSAFDCLSYETELSNQRYILFKGEWYKVSSDYFNELVLFFNNRKRETHAGTPSPLMVFPDFPRVKGHREGAYCIDVANANPNLISLDQKNVKVSTTLSSVEPCDLLSFDGKFIHLKKKYGSSALSHLFAQGKVSAELLKTEDRFRKGLRKKIRNEGKINQDIVPLGKIDPSNYKIIFGIIDNTPGVLKLPFFSMVNFQATGKYLEALGYEVFITKIYYA
ncbi:MAG: TIGR04141 family sporadically distributed protein [Saprospiraceae bacterium]